MELYDALKRMRELSKENIPFSVSFVSLNQTKGTSNGVRTIDKCVLRTGLSEDRSRYANTLISCTDLNSNKEKNFYLPLLLKFNNIDID